MENCKCAFCGKLLKINNSSKMVFCDNKECETFVNEEGVVYTVRPVGV